MPYQSFFSTTFVGGLFGPSYRFECLCLDFCRRNVLEAKAYSLCYRSVLMYATTSSMAFGALSTLAIMYIWSPYTSLG